MTHIIVLAVTPVGSIRAGKRMSSMLNATCGFPDRRGEVLSAYWFPRKDSTPWSIALLGLLQQSSLGAGIESPTPRDRGTEGFCFVLFAMGEPGICLTQFLDFVKVNPGLRERG